MQRALTFLPPAGAVLSGGPEQKLPLGPGDSLTVERRRGGRTAAVHLTEHVSLALPN